jgi:hypothetical protein
VLTFELTPPVSIEMARGVQRSPHENCFLSMVYASDVLDWGFSLALCRFGRSLFQDIPKAFWRFQWRLRQKLP